jgi:arylsulfatase A-like enzyme
VFAKDMPRVVSHDRKEDQQSKDHVQRNTQEDSKKSNILIIVTDDVGTSHVPYWGDNIVPMEIHCSASIARSDVHGCAFFTPLCTK